MSLDITTKIHYPIEHFYPTWRSVDTDFVAHCSTDVRYTTIPIKGYYPLVDQQMDIEMGINQYAQPEQSCPTAASAELVVSLLNVTKFNILAKF